MLKTFTTQCIAILASLGAVAAVSAGWVLHLHINEQVDARAGGPLVLGLPVALASLTLIWLLARGLIGMKVKWSFALIVVAAAVFAGGVVAALCGPVACFRPGAYAAIGWFIVGGVAFAALAHHYVRERLRFR